MPKFKLIDLAKVAENSYAMHRASDPTGQIKDKFNKKGVQAYMLKNGIMAIPGTNEPRDWFRNLNGFKLLEQTFGIDSFSAGHRGANFHTGFLKHSDILLPFIREHKPALLVGHSLGGAAAQILGVAENIRAITFGAPNVKKGAGKLKHEAGILNVARADDSICTVPSADRGYRKLGRIEVLLPPARKFGIDHKMKHYIRLIQGPEGKGLPKTW